METDYGRLVWAGAYAALLLAAAGYDVRSRRIPNWSVLAIAGLFLIGLPFGWPVASWTACLAAMALALAIGFPLFAVRRMGAGDVKLLAAAALFTGLDHMLLLLVATAVAGGALALVALTARPYATALAAAGWPQTRPGVPYGVAIAAGAIYAGWNAGLFTATQRLVHIDPSQMDLIQ
jgi:prepilin peptidase CpaA